MIFRLTSRTTVEHYLKRDNRILLPVGSTEQHGSFGLIGTDHLITEKIAEAVAEKTNTMVAPTIPFGMSVHHTAFKGCITIKPTAIIALFNDIFWSLNHQGFHRILILNGHGGNKNTYSAMMSELLNDYPDLKVKFRSWWEGEGVTEFIQKRYGIEEGHHCSPSELSIIMYLFPEYITKQRTKYRQMPERPVFETAARFKELFPDGIVGSNPNLANREDGEKLFNLCVTAFTKEMDLNWQ